MVYKDSFETLDEILDIGDQLEVDLALQSGDLFHELYPSHECICKTLRIFEKYVFGERVHKFKYFPIEGVDHSFVNLLSGRLSII